MNEESVSLRPRIQHLVNLPLSVVTPKVSTTRPLGRSFNLFVPRFHCQNGGYCINLI